MLTFGMLMLTFSVYDPGATKMVIPVIESEGIVSASATVLNGSVMLPTQPADFSLPFRLT